MFTSPRRVQSRSIVASTRTNRSSSMAIGDGFALPAMMPRAAHTTISAARKCLSAPRSTAIARNAIASRTEHPQTRPAMNAISGSAAGTSLRLSSGLALCTLERRERLYVMRVGEEIEEVESGEVPPGRDQPARVTGKGYRIAREITNHLTRLLTDRVDRVLSRARARRIEKDEVR